MRRLILLSIFILIIPLALAGECSYGTCEYGYTCDIPTNTCVPETTPQTCGNDIIEGTEECDGTDLGGVDCTAAGYPYGVIACDQDCTFDISSCTTTAPTSNGSEDIQTLITKTREKLNSIDVEIGNVLGYNIASSLQNLDIYESQLGTQDQSIIQQSVEAIAANLPTYIDIKSKITGIPGYPPQVINAYLLQTQLSESQILQAQNLVRIITTVIPFTKEDDLGSNDYTLIKKQITTTHPNYQIVEYLPVASSSATSNQQFQTMGDQIITFSQSDEISYIVPGDVSSKINEFNTLVIPSSMPEGPTYEEPICGDGVCTKPLEDKITCPKDCTKKIRWGYVLVIILMLAGGIYYLNFYKGKLSMANLMKPRSKLFTTSSDEKAIIDYVRKALSKGTSRQAITTVLLSKGWTKAQVNYAFKHVK